MRQTLALFYLVGYFSVYFIVFNSPIDFNALTDLKPIFKSNGEISAVTVGQ